MGCSDLPIPAPLEDERIQKALKLSEDERLDFKRLGNVENVVKTASAMANTKGGWIVLGIDDGRKCTGTDRVYGIEERPECLGEVRRGLSQRISPPLRGSHAEEPTETPIRCTLRDGSTGTVVLLRIHQSRSVHSLVDGGTYVRSGSQNRQLSAHEITELSLRRGTQSAVDATADVPIELLDTDYYRDYARQRNLTRPIAEQLKHLGLSKQITANTWHPTWAAILLFAENPGGLLNQKCAIRMFHYRGHQIEHSENTNLIRPPETIDGPVLVQIREGTRKVLHELDSGVQVSPSGFEVKQKYPKRVIQEAVTNAVIHRDYRLSQDIHIRIFANRIEVESPGVFPGAVTPLNLRQAGSNPRNRALVDHMREFPNPPNLDAGEGVRMMFATLEADGLFPPIYRDEEELGREAVQVDLINEARQSEWSLTEDYLREHDTLTNADVRRITNTRSNVKASKLLREWVERGLVVVDNPEAGTRNRRYRSKGTADTRGKELQALLSKDESKQS